MPDANIDINAQFMTGIVVVSAVVGAIVMRGLPALLSLLVSRGRDDDRDSGSGKRSGVDAMSNAQPLWSQVRDVASRVDAVEREVVSVQTSVTELKQIVGSLTDRLDDVVDRLDRILAAIQQQNSNSIRSNP